jgi:hypothetical protein
MNHKLIPDLSGKNPCIAIKADPGEVVLGEWSFEHMEFPDPLRISSVQAVMVASALLAAASEASSLFEAMAKQEGGE